MDLSGFGQDEIGDLIVALPYVPDVDPPVVEHDFDVGKALEQIDEPEMQRGDVWQLGPHLLMCGDATNPEDMARLMGDAKAALVVSDPPYNVAVESDSARLAEAGTNSIMNDDMPAEEFAGFLNAVFQRYSEIMVPTSAIHSPSYQREFENAMNAAGIVVRSQCV
ncbi:hypothetical protein [Paenibacillus lentus]|uniref:hypothetical protein n=1 Tax=Paenibacillus lentus TaxID=1338368 RepID=UPI002684B229